MNRLTFVCAAVTLLAWAIPGQADPIAYTETATGTGTLDGISFTDALVTVTLVADTSNVSSPPGGSETVLGIATVNVFGVGTDTFTDPTGAFLSDFGNSIPPFIAAGFYDIDPGVGAPLILASEDPAFASYDLTLSTGPLSGTAVYNPPFAFNTVFGSFNLLSVTGNSSTFSATTPAPEPSAWLLFSIGLAAVGSFSRQSPSRK